MRLTGQRAPKSGAFSTEPSISQNRLGGRFRDDPTSDTDSEGAKNTRAARGRRPTRGRDEVARKEFGALCNGIQAHI